MENQLNLVLGSGGLSTPERQQAWKSALKLALSQIPEVLFIPYALQDHDGYAASIERMDFVGGCKLRSIHREMDPKRAIANAEAVYVGGGNTFRLLHQLYELDLLESIKNRIQKDHKLYIGISAGSNLAGATICTTNDMPIVEPKSFEALRFLDWQINPHYFHGKLHYEQNGTLVPYGGETRDDRLREYHEMNSRPILAMYEGEVLRVHQGKAQLQGVGGAKLFRKGQDAFSIAEGSFIDLDDSRGS